MAHLWVSISALPAPTIERTAGSVLRQKVSSVGALKRHGLVKQRAVCVVVNCSQAFREDAGAPPTLDFSEVDRTEDLEASSEAASVFSVVVCIPPEWSVVEHHDSIVRFDVHYFEPALGKTIQYGSAQLSFRSLLSGAEKHNLSLNSDHGESTLTVTPVPVPPAQHTLLSAADSGALSRSFVFKGEQEEK